MNPPVIYLSPKTPIFPLLDDLFHKSLHRTSKRCIVLLRPRKGTTNARFHSGNYRRGKPRKRNTEAEFSRWSPRRRATPQGVEQRQEITGWFSRRGELRKRRAGARGERRRFERERLRKRRLSADDPLVVELLRRGRAARRDFGSGPQGRSGATNFGSRPLTLLATSKSPTRKPGFLAAPHFLPSGWASKNAALSRPTNRTQS